MLKLQFETESQSISFWIDDVSGALCVQNDNEIMEIPLNAGIELLNSLKMKQEIFMESNRKGFFKWIR